MVNKSYEYGGQYRPKDNRQSMRVNKENTSLPNNQRNWMSEHYTIQKPALVGAGVVASITGGIASYSKGYDAGARQSVRYTVNEMIANLAGKPSKPPTTGQNWTSNFLNYNRKNVQKGLQQAENFANKATRGTGTYGYANRPSMTSNSNAIKTASKVGKGFKFISRAARVAGPVVGTAWATYDTMKWASQWHKDNPGATNRKYKAYGLDVNTPGKYGVDF